jgi:hypothetical protein
MSVISPTVLNRPIWKSIDQQNSRPEQMICIRKTGHVAANERHSFWMHELVIPRPILSMLPGTYMLTHWLNVSFRYSLAIVLSVTHGWSIPDGNNDVYIEKHAECISFRGSINVGVALLQQRGSLLMFFTVLLSYIPQDQVTGFRLRVFSFMRDEEFIHICFSLTKHIFIV